MYLTECTDQIVTAIEVKYRLTKARVLKTMISCRDTLEDVSAEEKGELDGHFTMLSYKI